MLTDVKLGFRDAGMAMVVGAIGGGSSPTPRKIATGLYMSTHWSFEHATPDVVEQYPEIEGLENAFGVCDSPSQFMTKFGELLEKDPRRFAVSFVKISRADQSPDGGWRWHKWGPYVGAQTPTTEYLYDEPLISEVHTFHVYEVRG